MNKNNTGDASISDVIKGKKFTSATAGVSVTGTHECPTITDLLPSRSNPAGSEQILSGYQGIDSNGAIINGIAEAGGKYEIVEVAASTSNSTTFNFYTTLSNATKCFGAATSIPSTSRQYVTSISNTLCICGIYGTSSDNQQCWTYTPSSTKGSISFTGGTFNLTTKANGVGTLFFLPPMRIVFAE